MRRTLGLAVSVAVVAAGIAGGGGSAVAQRGPVVSGTYSSGPEHAWQALPPAYVGNDTGAADATVVVDPNSSRQKYTGVGFSLDETCVSNLWKLTPRERCAVAARLETCQSDPRGVSATAVHAA